MSSPGCSRCRSGAPSSSPRRTPPPSASPSARPPPPSPPADGADPPDRPRERRPAAGPGRAAPDAARAQGRRPRARAPPPARPPAGRAVRRLRGAARRRLARRPRLRLKPRRPAADEDLMIDLVVFSKDRPAQLDVLLGSIERFFVEWRDVALTVVHVATDDAAQRGYARVRALHPEIAFVDESTTEQSFKDITLALTGRNPLVAFLMDDQLFKAPFTLRRPEVARFLEDPETMCLSLRMDPGMDYCYPLDRHVAVPEFEAEGVWRWGAAEGDWAYPMSLDAHLFRTAELRPLLEAVAFRNPNSLEGALANAPLPHPRLACLREAPTVNIPDNRVQDVCDNRHGTGDAAALTARFLAGDRLDLEPLVGLRTPSPHHEIPLTWRGLAHAEPAAAGPAPQLSAVVS